MIEAEWWEYDNREEMADAVVGDIEFIVDSALDARGASLLALAGGATPVPILEALATRDLDWKKVMIIPTDDRLVPLDNPLSNAAMLARIFLPRGARVIPVTTEKADNHKLAGNAAAARLADLPWPPDLVWLGMGEDGHTASIFNGPDLDDALNAPPARRMVGVMPDPMPENAPVPRVTLTRAAIHSARAVTIVIAGQAKRDILEQAIREGDSSPWPIGRVLAGLETPVDIHWLAA